jgi:RNA polymerase sigma-70 factor (ECF subfamily)
MPLEAAPETPDDDLVARARDGDFAAFEELVRRHQRRVFALALGIVRNPAEAEEVVQETFLSSFSHLDSFRGDARFSTWIYRVASNHALMRLRKKKPEPQGDALDLEPRMSTQGTSPFEDLAHQFGTTVPAVKSRLHRARLQLRELLDRKLRGRPPA